MSKLPSLNFEYYLDADENCQGNALCAELKSSEATAQVQNAFYLHIANYVQGVYNGQQDTTQCLSFLV